MEQEQRKQLLELYKDIRVADVRDAMDTHLLHHSGSMDCAIRPLFRTRAYGIAKTARYIPYQGTIPEMKPDEYNAWAGWYYKEICTYPWIGEIEPGDFCVIDQSGICAGLMGSANTLSGIKRGAHGYGSNGGVRDTDEIILQRVPFGHHSIAQTMV
jgi:regulator of RNase E activity RraA